MNYLHLQILKKHLNKVKQTNQNDPLYLLETALNEITHGAHPRIINLKLFNVFIVPDDECL